MNLTIDLPHDKNAVLSAKACAKGSSAEDCARQVLDQDLALEWLQKSWESAKQDGLDHLSIDEIDAGIAAARNRRESCYIA